ncbi:MAG: NfeD family protein [Candidatus Gastranaerophilales bacterium]|nr:NfeD family protein [Candidatus Gastranaerophilales bacterium]
MELWLVWLISGIVLVILEIFTPTLFLLSIAFACFIVAFLSWLEFSLLWQAIVFAILAVLLIKFIRPLFISKVKDDTNTNIYNDKEATVIEQVDNAQLKGRIKVFDEEWAAKSVDDSVIESGSVVIIEKIESMSAIVRKK